MPRWLRLALDCVLPRDCDACERPLPGGVPGAVCAACLATIVPPSPRCDTCDVPTPHPVRRCADCDISTPAFSSARALGLYLPSQTGLNPLARAVHALKYRGRRVVAGSLGELLAERYPFAHDALLVPVPLHLDRLRARGFNQALLLARALGRRRGLATLADVLRRRRDTPLQAGLGAAARQRNLRDAFVVVGAGCLRRRDVVLVDDVLTTGATANACATALRAAGAARVDVFVVGRTPPPAYMVVSSKSHSVESFGTRC
jgi:ComF family protein